MSASSSSVAGPSTSKNEDAPAISDKEKTELNQILNREAAAFQRDMEVERIQNAFKLKWVTLLKDNNFRPYDILGLDYFDISEEAIKKKYKQLSLFIHPDKATHPNAPDAFDRLKKAQSALMDKELRLDIDSVIEHARTEILKANNVPSSTPNTDVRILRLEPPFKRQLQDKVKTLLFDEELRKRKAIRNNLANEGFEAKKKEEEISAKKRKAEDDARWEENRDKRVEGWRSFQHGGVSKKKKKKAEVLG